MKKKRILALVLSTMLIVGSTLPVMAEEIQPGQSTEEEQQYSDSVEKGQEQAETSEASMQQMDETLKNGGGYIADELDNNTPVYRPDIAAYSEVPSSYQTDISYSNRLIYPEVRNQGSYGTCWAFASLGLAEFDLINDGAYTSDINLSELQLAHFVYNSVQDPIGGTKGDYAKYYNDRASTDYLSYGGNFTFASRRLGQWCGPVDEELVSYSQAQAVLNSGLSDSYAYNFDKAHLANTYLINIRENADDVKRAIQEHGAVGVSYYSDPYCYTYAEDGTNTYYDTAKTGGGHAVMIVGWDDNFSKDNFTGQYKPSQNGAWRVRNSWGFNTSYFWMSYETVSLDDTAWVFDFEKDDGYDNNYQLDGGVSTYPDTNNTKVANVFTTRNIEGVASETLKAVSLSFTHVADVQYKVEIYTDLKTENQPYSGTLQDSATTEGITTFAGVYTVKLDNEVQLAPGTSFAVVVTMDKMAMDQEQSASICSAEDMNKLIWDCPVSINNGNSRVMYANGSYAWPWGNYCIKAFTSNNQEEAGLGDKLYGRSLTLNGSIEVNFYMELPESIVKNENAYMEFTTEDGTVHNVAVSEATIKKFGDKTYYVFKCPVYAMEMTDQISAHMVVDGKSGEIYTYSVKQYSDQILNGQNSYTNETKNVIKAMLNYGAAAQVQFEYKADTLANENLNDTEKMITDADFNNYINSRTIDENIKGISCYGTSLVLNSEISLRHYFQLESGYEIGDYNFQYTDTDGNVVKLEPKQKSGSTDLYYIEIPNIKAYELNQMPKTIVQSKGMTAGNGIEITYGPFSYCYNVVNNQSTEKSLKNLANTLYWYWHYADAYVKSQGY